MPPIPFDDTTIANNLTGKQVRVYFNLRNGYWSVKYKDRVALYAKNLCLSKCLFKVSEAGRQRVLRTRQKNVHAYVEGTFECLLSEKEIDFNLRTWKSEQIRYNPYETKTFISVETKFPVREADLVVLENGFKKVYAMAAVSRSH